jgi:hypothetical protein
MRRGPDDRRLGCLRGFDAAHPERAAVSWVWLDGVRVDFGRHDADEVHGERTIWLYADARAVLGVPDSAGEAEVRRAYRRLAREHHPDTNRDDPDALGRFHELQRAYAVATGDAEVTVEPTEGAWWRLTGISAPWSPARGSLAVAGLTFEVSEPQRVPLRAAEDAVRITYAGRSLPLTIGYSRSASALPLWQARLASAAEWAFLVLLCLLLVPLVALVVAADLYLLSGTNDVLAWASVLAIVGLGYGTLAAVLIGTGHEVPTPRRAIRRTRAAVAEVRALLPGR